MKMNGMSANQEWIGHLSELRKRLIVTGIWFVASMGAGLYLSPSILLLLKSRAAAGAPIDWHVFSFTDGLFVYLRCAFLLAALLTLPLAMYHAWAFVRPGLTAREARGTFGYVPASFLLFVGGLSFGYFLVFPMMLKFMQSMNASVGAVELYGIERYFAFLFGVLLPLGIAFEMPLIMLFLTRLGLLDPTRIRQVRKYAYVGLAIVGSCISPPDLFSHLSVTVPLLLLFECSALVACRQFRRSASPAAGPAPG
ncbi:twin-arginine translocase subunit TatC [Cohnella sp. 56]|uniref:twin-arginine translocase subunit TatC n=1 Tax=Cohnella sp. 56 TaxID=3113722 RepID=UPI0030E8D0B1